MFSEDARLLAASSPLGLQHVTTQGRLVPFEHLILINDHVLQVAAGEINRLIVTTPPRHGKSELLSKYTPAWYLGTHPDKQVMLASYQANFAASWGRRARDVLEEHGEEIFGVQVAQEPKAADWWMIKDRSGVMVTAGIGGALTGKGADLLQIDDPVKDAEQAQSQVYRDKTWAWWQATASTRLMPGGACIVVMTRWHEDDLVGRLLNHEGGLWTVVNLPAIAEEDDQLGREPGQALCPELYDEEALEAIRRRSGGYWFASLYQQRPAPAEGFMFKRSDLRYWHTETETLGAAERVWYMLPDDDGSTRRVDAGVCTIFQTVDVALSSKDTADWTVVATWASTPARDLLLLDLERRQFEEQQTVQFLAAANEKHSRPPMWIERFGAGRNPLARLATLGHPVMEIPNEAGAQADKVTREFGAIALNESHKLFLPAESSDWKGGFVDELAGFPNGRNDDMVDVTSYAARLLPFVRPSSNKATGNDGTRRKAKPLSRGMRSQQF